MDKKQFATVAAVVAGIAFVAYLVEKKDKPSQKQQQDPNAAATGTHSKQGQKEQQRGGTQINHTPPPSKPKHVMLTEATAVPAARKQCASIKEATAVVPYGEYGKAVVMNCATGEIDYSMTKAFMHGEAKTIASGIQWAKGVCAQNPAAKAVFTKGSRRATLLCASNKWVQDSIPQ